MTDRHAILDWLDVRGPAMEVLLAEIVDIDSGSAQAAGVDAVRDRIAAFLAEHGVAVEQVATPGGACLWARTGPAADTGHALLMGHMDTVFPPGEAARRPFTVELRDGRRIGRGPGCADMKAGLVMNAFLLAGFAATGAPMPVAALFTRDEEVGSPHGRTAIEGAATGARAVFNAEPGRRSGNVVSSRRGGTFYRATVTGRAAHAGLNPHEGRSAIEEMARKILAWHALSSEVPDVTVSVGLVSGGQAVNMIAPDCEASIDLRFTEPETGARLDAEICAIATTCTREGLRGTIERLGGFAPVVETPANQALVNLYLGAARDLGQTTQAEFTRSCADSGLTAAMGVPTVCGTGPVGCHAHSPEEYVELETFVPRARAVALSILRLGGPA